MNRFQMGDLNIKSHFANQKLRLINLELFIFTYQCHCVIQHIIFLCLRNFHLIIYQLKQKQMLDCSIKTGLHKLIVTERLLFSNFIKFHAYQTFILIRLIIKTYHLIYLFFQIFKKFLELQLYLMQIRQSQKHVLKSSCLAEFGYYEDKNYPTRQNMEDNYIIEDGIDKQGSGLFAILDGHGGGQVSQYCANVIPNLFEQEYSKQKNNIKLVFQRVCAKADQQLKLVGASQTGSTCCLVFIKKSGGKRTCHIANLGDTRAVLSLDNGIARRVTIDHKVTNPNQQERVKKQGGLILKGRVAGQLAITRALGDLQLKSQGVSNIPDYEQFEITGKTNYLIVASDGLWDVCEDQQALDLIKGCKNTLQISKTLVQYSLKNGSKDNISVLALKF